jgi:hypothetical protein
VTERTIRRDEYDLTRRVGRKSDERVVATGRCVNYLDTVSDTLFDAVAGSTFQYHDDRLGEPTCSRRGTNALHKLTCCSWSISPPARRTRPNNIRRVDEEHRRSLPLPEALLGQMGE